ncbi:MAG: GntR family transcriptional regulator [Paracoccaceae bacterium]|nr:GntR family transcriptional regulator [Paracoccaceae bacterium]
MTETAIPRRTLHDELVARLRRQIIEGALAPGDKINEKALCQTYAVSRTPLREALKVLAREGLVMLTPHRGAQVSMLTVEDMEEAFPVIGALEALAGELACQNATDAEITRIGELHGHMVAAHTDKDRARYFRLNQQIHEALAEAARNPTLTAMRQMLDGRVSRARYYANISAPRWDQTMDEHREILAAYQARDGARLGAVLKRHLANKLETLKSVLRAEDETTI